MYRNHLYLVLLSILTMVLALSLLSASVAFAQSETPPPESACSSCHENLYLIHDTGKWYCMCKRRAECSVCHAGQADTYDKELAHQGLIANPIQNNPGICQSCHGEDYEAYIERFVLIAGVSQPPMSGPKYEPINMRIEAPSEPSGALILAGKTYASWQLIGLGVVTGLLLGIFIFGCRCWKDDRAQGRI